MTDIKKREYDPKKLDFILKVFSNNKNLSDEAKVLIIQAVGEIEINDKDITKYNAKKFKDLSNKFCDNTKVLLKEDKND